MIIIGIDIDGVVNDLTLFHVACGTKYCFEHNISYNIVNNGMDSVEIFQWNINTDTLFWNQFYLHLLLSSEFVRPFVSDVTKQLIEEGHTIIFVTARKNQDLPPEETRSMLDITLRYLQGNNIYYSDIVLSQNKNEVIDSRHINVMIEDNPFFFQKYKLILNIPLLCFDALYNTQISGPNIFRVYSWYDVLQKIHLIERIYNVEHRKK